MRNAGRDPSLQGHRHNTGGLAARAGADAAAKDAERDRERERDRDREIDRVRILARHALVREGDYFQILGVPRDAGPHEIRRAHEGLARELDPRGLAPGLADDFAEPLAAIATVVAEGARVLCDDRLRALYQSHLPDAGPERSA